MTALSLQQVDAAHAYVSVTIDTFADEKGVHAETAIAGLARMAGTFLFRSFNFPLEDITPGQPVLSEQANEKGPGLINILAAVLGGGGFSIDGSAIEQESGEEHEPLLDFLETQSRLEAPLAEISVSHGLDFQQAAEAAAAATALLIGQTSQVLDPTIGFNIAAYGFVEGSKTCPTPVPAK